MTDWNDILEFQPRKTLQHHIVSDIPLVEAGLEGIMLSKGRVRNLVAWLSAEGRTCRSFSLGTNSYQRI